MPNSVRETRNPRVRARRTQRRQEILEAAWGLARRDGIALMSLRTLAAAVGLRAPSLYEYFPSKDAIYDAMFAEGWAALAAHTQAVPQTGDRMIDAVAAMDAFLAFCADDHARYQLMFTRVVPGWEPSPEAYAPAVTYYEEILAHLVRLGVTDLALVDLLTAIGSGLAAQQAANDPGGDRYRRLVPAALQMFLAHVDRTAASRPPTDAEEMP
ncbi:MAG TPA: TetR/AcrR family transcriptional regulator [Euzebya sp.]|nr:TetR/AcrR family transcriptional regulator [Euzebya sp.]